MDIIMTKVELFLYLKINKDSRQVIKYSLYAFSSNTVKFQKSKKFLKDTYDSS